MSEARERLGQAGYDVLTDQDHRNSASNPPDPWAKQDALDVLDAFLDYPDDLLAVLVEEGVLERGYESTTPEWVQDDTGPFYRRTERDTR